MSSAYAPFIYFDGVGASGMTGSDIAVLTLEAVAVTTDDHARPITHKVVVAHLRMGRQALASLRAALDKIEARESKVAFRN